LGAAKTRPARGEEAVIEEEIDDLERRLAELEGAPNKNVAEVEALQQRLNRLRESAGPSAMDRVRLARHADRPYTLDFVERIFTDWMELHGDRKFADDPAIVAGLAKFRDKPVCVVGHQKGRTTKERQYRNFGMPMPEGYRKALRVMKLAEKFGRPVFTFIDTPGAYPGIDAEERGQAEAIAYNLREMAKLRVPVVCTITGEGGSGGALAIGVGDVVQILENAVYSVISPEGCAAILWKDAAEAPRAAASLRITAHELLDLGIVDCIVPEPGEGAHEDYDMAARLLEESLASALDSLKGLRPEERVIRRFEKFRRMGRFAEE
jgi:acetyl-CoA carboxylase carboxyl transferase subunit alpha